MAPKATPIIGASRPRLAGDILWLGFTGFFSIAIMLSLLIFIGEAVRNAFDPRKSFR